MCVWSCNQTGARWVFTCLLWSISWWGCWLSTGTWSLRSFSTETCTQHTVCEYISASFIFIYQLNLIHYTCKGKTGRGGEDDNQHRAAGQNQTLQLDLDPLYMVHTLGKPPKHPQLLMEYFLAYYQMHHWYLETNRYSLNDIVVVSFVLICAVAFYGRDDLIFKFKWDYANSWNYLDNKSSGALFWLVAALHLW